MKKRHKEKRALGALSIQYVILVFLFLYLPIIMIFIYSFNSNDSNIVFKGFSAEYYVSLFSNRDLMQSFWLSIKLAIVSTLISIVLGTLATIGMHRYSFKLKGVLNGLLYIPIVIPELIIGIASLASFTLIKLSMGFATMVFAHVTFCVPFMIITLRARIAGFDPSIEEAAMDLGANQLRTLWRVTLPMLRPGIISGAMLSLTLSLDDLIISSFVAGPGDSTFPMEVYGMARGKITTDVYALSTLMIVVTVLVYLAATFNKSRRLKRELA
ncbi:MAG: ABC transporter permease [Lachnospiraceae bacterium]